MPIPLRAPPRATGFITLTDLVQTLRFAAGLERAADGSLRLVVRNADGTPGTAAQAAKYVVQVTGNLGGAWTVLPNALVVENGALKIVDPAANAAGVAGSRLRLCRPRLL